MNPRISRMAQRLSDIIDESSKVMEVLSSNEYGNWIEDREVSNEWIIKSINIIALIFGMNSIQCKELMKLKESNINDRDDVLAFKGILKGSLDDLNNGFVVGQEFLIAGEVFDSVIEESRHLLNTNHKDAAAVLGRVVVEDALKRIARNNGIPDSMATSRINDELKKNTIYNQPQWRQIQAWLDIGNKAAHGDFDSYQKDDVNNMLNGIELFLGSNAFN